MNTQTEPQKPKAVEPEYAPHQRIIGARFMASIPFAGETDGVQVGRNCDSITVARLEADGSAVAIGPNQRADGLLVKRRVHDRATGARYVDQAFVCWANLRGVQYGE